MGKKEVEQGDGGHLGGSAKGVKGKMGEGLLQKA